MVVPIPFPFFVFCFFQCIFVGGEELFEAAMFVTEAEACSKDLSNHLVKGVAWFIKNGGETRGKGWRMKSE